MLERCLGSRQSFGMLLPGGFPKGKGGVEWVGALAGRHPPPPFFWQPVLKGGMPDASISGQSITRMDADNIVPRAERPPCSAFPSVPLFRAALTLLLIIKPQQTLLTALSQIHRGLLALWFLVFFFNQLPW